MLFSPKKNVRKIVIKLFSLPEIIENYLWIE